MSVPRFAPIFSMKEWLAEDFREIRRAILDGDVRKELNMVDLALYHASAKLDPEEVEAIRSIYASDAQAWLNARRDRWGRLEGALHASLMKAQGELIRALARKGIGIWVEPGMDALDAPPVDFDLEATGSNRKE